MPLQQRPGTVPAGDVPQDPGFKWAFCVFSQQSTAVPLVPGCGSVKVKAMHSDLAQHSDRHHCGLASGPLFCSGESAVHSPELSVALWITVSRQEVAPPRSTCVWRLGLPTPHSSLNARDPAGTRLRRICNSSTTGAILVPPPRRGASPRARAPCALASSRPRAPCWWHAPRSGGWCVGGSAGRNRVGLAATNSKSQPPMSAAPVSTCASCAPTDRKANLAGGSSSSSVGKLGRRPALSLGRPHQGLRYQPRTRRASFQPKAHRSRSYI